MPSVTAESTAELGTTTVPEAQPGGFPVLLLPVP